MHSTFAVVLTVLCVSVTLATEDSEFEPSNLHEAPPVKLNKTLRRALLKALTDLEEKSAEQDANGDSQDEFPMDESRLKNFDFVDKKELQKNFGKSTFSSSNFHTEDEEVREDKLGNSSLIEIEKYVSSNFPVTSKTAVKKQEEFLKGFQDTDRISFEKSTTIYETKQDPVAARSVKSSNPSSANAIETATSRSTTQFTETLTRSESNGIATANVLVSPKPTVSSPTVPRAANVSLTSSKPYKEEGNVENVKIFQAPLVAAFTVQQDERGIPRSVVPIYRPSGDGLALTLQEQLDFKQKLLEKQLLELQQQQVQQTQFLLRQQHAYEEQVRQKQQQEIFLQDHARLNQLQDQARFKQLEEQRQFDDQIRQKQFEEQRFYQQRLQQQHLQHQQLRQQQQQIQQQQTQQQQLQQHLPIEQNNGLSFKQTFKSSNVHVQPSISSQVPHDTPAKPFQSQYQDQLRTQQLRQHHQQQLQQQQLQHQQHSQQDQLQQQQQLHQSHQQQKLQQSSASFSADLQLPVASATRFNRQEAFGSVGNFGFNVDNRSPAGNIFGINNFQQRNPQSVIHNQFPQFRQSRPVTSSTPAKQIQHLLYQSGVANELQGGAQGFSGSQEDLNIVSKVLALNVGAVPLSNNLQFARSQRVNTYASTPSVA